MYLHDFSGFLSLPESSLSYVIALWHTSIILKWGLKTYLLAMHSIVFECRVYQTSILIKYL